MPTKILVTGGCGFIGSNFIRYLLKQYPDIQVVNLDLLTYAGNLANLQGIDQSRYTFIKGDIADASLVDRVVKDQVEAIINFAAESHVDRSLYHPESFINTNILGTQVLLEAARRYQVPRFIQISTDEVYGSLGADDDPFTEKSPLDPSSTYSASKAAADMLIKACEKSFGYKAIITRGSNNYGPYQFPEKLIPLFISNAIENKPLPVYGDGLQVRDWIFVEDHCEAIDLIRQKGKLGEVYNIGGVSEYPNIEMTKTILNVLGKPESLIKYVKDRPGHDRRYALNISKIKKELGWNPKYQVPAGIKKTIDWYLGNKDWWQKIKSGEYRKYYEKHYQGR
ncbi:MAG: dTDP-glucose 4,6-dehydratase [Planctomycetes bacterium]|nr:dTDP-glucose 4,6-dehydratase [Planctomycetota bacterium]